MFWEHVDWVQFPAARPSMYTVYILRSLKTGRTYVGYSSNVRLRFKQHNLGKVVATRSYRPWEILYTENSKTLFDVKLREKYWKSGGGRRKLRLYFKDGFPPPQSGGGARPPRKAEGGNSQQPDQVVCIKHSSD